MLLSIPIEILEIIFNLVVHPSNCNSMKLRVSCCILEKNAFLISLQNKRNKCDYCKYIFREWKQYPTISRNPCIYSCYIKTMVLCKTHTYTCNLCNRNGSYNEYCILTSQCKECKISNKS